MRYSFWIVLLGLALLPLRVSGQEITAASDYLAKALQESDVYVDKAMSSKVNAQTLTTLTDTHKGSERVFKIAVVSQLPESGRKFGTQEAYTEALHRFLKLNNGTLVIVGANGVSAFTNGLSPEKTAAILQKTSTQIQRDPVSGLRKTMQAFDGQMGSTALTPMAAAPAAAGGSPPAAAGSTPGSEGASTLTSWLLPAGGGLLLVCLILSIVSARRRAV